MNDPIQVLMDEHRVIEKVLDALEAAADRGVEPDFYARAADFCANYADKRHHAKEEDRLFPVLEGRGIPRAGGPIGVMCDEHVIGRRCVARLRELAEAGDLEGLRRTAAEYVALLRAHIQKEDQVLFAMARGVLHDDDVAALRTSFAEAEAGLPDRAAYEALAEALGREAAGDKA